MRQNSRVNDALYSMRSHSKLNSEAHSLNQDNEGIHGLEKSLSLRRSTKDALHSSIEVESSRDLFAAIRNHASPIPIDKPNFLKRFTQRFDILRKSTTEDDLLNNSFQLPGNLRYEGLVFGTPEILPLQELKSHSSLQNFNTDKEKSVASERAISPTKKTKHVMPATPDAPIHAIEMPKPERMQTPPKIRKFEIDQKITEDKENSENLEDGQSAVFDFGFLQNLYDVFVQIFSNGYIDPEKYNLAKSEEEVLNCLLQRKFFHRLTQTEMDLPLDQKLERINEIIKGRSNKRPEECYKFILTRANKCLKRQLSSYNTDSDESEKIFYEHYFGELAKKMNIPIQQFVYPITRKQIEVAKLNAAYFDRIFRSPTFLQQVQEYIKEAVYVEYKDELKKKLKSFLSKYDIMLQKPKSDFHAVEKKLKEYLLKNKRCKLPWTLNEIKESIVRFQILVDSIKSKQEIKLWFVTNSS